MDDAQLWDLMLKRMREALESINQRWVHHLMEQIYEHDAFSLENYYRVAYRLGKSGMRNALPVGSLQIVSRGQVIAAFGNDTQWSMAGRGCQTALTVDEQVEAPRLSQRSE